MKKTVTVNLAGQVFHIDEDAFDALSAYLRAIKGMYSIEEGGDEILADIEARIAEIFLSNLKVSGKTVISITEVDGIIKMLGKPEEIESEAESTSEKKSEHTRTDAYAKAEKRLYRDTDDTIVAGVCSGLSNYFGISDPVWIRLLFVFLVIGGVGGGFLVYIILWIVVPEALTSAQKLQMRGEPVNLENIEKTFKDGIQNVENNFKNIREDENFFSKVVKGFGKAVVLVLKGLMIFIKGIVGLIFGIIVFALAVSLFALAVSGLAIIPAFNTYIFDHQILGYLSAIGIVLFFASTAVFLILIPIQIFSKNARPFRKSVSFSLLGVWILGLIFMMVGVADGTRQFSAAQTNTLTTEIAAENVPDTLIIRTNSSTSSNEDIVKISVGWKDFEISEDGFIAGRVRVNLEVSPDSNIYITERYRSKGANLESATQNVRNISYKYELKDNQLIIDDFLGSKVGSKKWREQSLLLTVQIPEGKIIAMDGLKDILKEKPPIKQTWGGYEIPLHSTAWRLENGYLIPLDTSIAVQMEAGNVELIDVSPKNSFKNVQVAGFIEAEIVKGAKLQVLTNDADRLDIRVSGSTLKISNKSQVLRPGNAKAVKVKIYMPSVGEIDVAGLSSVSLSGYTSGSLDADVAGNSTFIMRNVSVDQLNIDLAGISSFEGDASINKLRLKGAGACNVRALNMEVNDLNINLVGACNADVNVKDKIKGSLSGASNLQYKGAPTLDVSTSGASKVSSAN
jgi:phage shock protein PspC (stress-responsive transcriptional regulator)